MPDLVGLILTPEQRGSDRELRDDLFEGFSPTEAEDVTVTLCH